MQKICNHWNAYVSHTHTYTHEWHLVHVKHNDKMKLCLHLNLNRCNYKRLIIDM